MKIMKKKIFIIGVGPMGKSHAKAFLNKKDFELHLYDKLKINNGLKVKKKLPKNMKIDYLILSTGSIERFKVSNFLINNNKIKMILFEKFVFHKIDEFINISKKLLKNKIKSYVNIWGRRIKLKIFGKKIYKKNIKITVTVKEGSLLTNLIHFLNFSNELVDEYFKFNKKNINLRKIMSSHNFYDEVKGSVKLETLNKNKLIIKSGKNVSSFKISIKSAQDNFLILILNAKIFVYKNSILYKKFEFPYAFKTSDKDYKSLMNKKDKIYVSYAEAYKLSSEIINNISKPKNLVIR